jgi:crossover junction endodeoxyribonuclease RuvC
VRCLLPKATPDSADAADALAIAVTHAHSRKSSKLDQAVARADLRAQRTAS